MARPSLERNVKFKTLVQALGLPKPYVRGLLETLWDVANECGNPVLGSPRQVEAAAEWPGPSGKLFAALRDLRLIDKRHDGSWEIHDYWDHAPEYVLGRSRREAERKKERVCEGCGTAYQSADERSRYCSPACRTAAWRRRQDGPVTDCDGPVTLRNVTVTECDTTPAPAPLIKEEEGVPSSCPEPDKPATGPPVMTFPTVGKEKEWNLTEAKVAELRSAFPSLDVLAECRKAMTWVLQSPERRKTAKGMGRFLFGWLGRVQNRGPPASPAANHAAHKPTPAEFFGGKG